MALIVGTNTYATEAQLSAYADARGVTLVGDPSVLLTHGFDYIESLEGDMQGYRTDPAQIPSWPRTNVWVYGSLQDPLTWPQRIAQAQCQLAIEADTQALMPTVAANASGSVIEKTVDVITLKYDSGSGNTSPVFKAVTAIIKPLYEIAGGGSNFSVRASV